MSAARRLASLQELLAAEDEGAAVEIVAGELVEKAMGTALHGQAQRLLGERLGPYGRRGRSSAGWWILTEVTVALDALHVFRPDIAGWRRERMPVLPATFPVTLSPDWVCEVLSTSTARRDLGPKQRAYHAHDVSHYWLVDPERQTFTVQRHGPDGYTTLLVAGPGERVRAEPFEAVVIRTDELFGLV